MLRYPYNSNLEVRSIDLMQIRCICGIENGAKTKGDPLDPPKRVLYNN